MSRDAVEGPHIRVPCLGTIAWQDPARWPRHLAERWLDRARSRSGGFCDVAGDGMAGPRHGNLHRMFVLH